MPHDSISTAKEVMAGLAEALRASANQALAGGSDGLVVIFIGTREGEVDVIDQHTATLEHPTVVSVFDIEEDDLFDLVAQIMHSDPMEEDEDADE